MNVPIYDIDELEKIELTKRTTFAKSTQYNCFNYSKPMRIKSLYGGGKKRRKLKIQRQSEENIT